MTDWPRAYGAPVNDGHHRGFGPDKGEDQDASWDRNQAMGVQKKRLGGAATWIRAR